MGIVVVQTAIAAASSASSVTATFASPTTSGNLVVAECAHYPNNGFFRVTDNGSGNSWPDAVPEVVGSILAARQVYCNGINGRSGHAITLELTGSGFPDIIVYEVAGQAAGGPDKVAGGSVPMTLANTPYDGPDTATTTQANALLLGHATDDTLAAQTLSCASPWTQDRVQAHTGSVVGILGGSRIVSATGAYHFTAQSDANGSVGLFLISAWKEATAAAGFAHSFGAICG